MTLPLSAPSRREDGQISEALIDLKYHGDQDLRPGLIDLAVNVRHAPRPAWLDTALQAALDEVADYPDPAPARRVVAARHRRADGEVLLTAGAAEAFVLLARALRPRHAVVIHPQFTEPEAALRAAGHQVERVVLAPPFTLDPALVPETADLVFIGNPTNPTSVLHPRKVIESLLRPGRLVVVDEAFADSVPGEPESLAEREDLSGVVVVRSLTKTWGLAGLRCGYLLASAQVIDELANAQPLWSVNTLALAATIACSSEAAVTEAQQWAHGLAADRRFLLQELAPLIALGVQVVPNAATSFILIRVPELFSAASDNGVQEALREKGFAVRRGDTFPGLGGEWIRVAVRDRTTTQTFVAALQSLVGTVR